MWRSPLAAVAAMATIIAVGTVGVPPARAGGPGEPLYGDLNGDGPVDRARLGAAPRACTVTVEFGRPEGGHLPPRQYTYQAPGRGASARCPDLGVAVDLDTPATAEDPGMDELVLGWYGGHPGDRSIHDLVVLRNLAVSSSFPALPLPNFLGLADFDGDGRQDLYAWTDQGQGFATYLNDGAGALRPGPVRYCSGQFDHQLADFDRDGAMDVALTYVDRCADGTRGVVVVLDDGTAVELQNMTDGERCWTVHVLDADHNNVPDVLTYHLPTGLPTTFLGVGDGTFVRSPLALRDTVTVSGAAPTNIPLLDNDWASRRAKISIVTPPTAGTAQVRADRSIVYIPGSTPGLTDRLVYRVTQDGRTSDATVIVKITP
ncbi:FG-GAP-like repeat-containing protein [Plantactinospora sp. B5E13]|uniref:FG-GAP-like repeat-containing protein n=1 Tax=Plantactinospora sp. B5E13 TaxID=3153758 RepID=UPI00325E0BAA